MAFAMRKLTSSLTALLLVIGRAQGQNCKHRKLEPAKACTDESSEAHEYCVLGAGPAGLQVGQYMLARSWDYVILERNNSAGSFFEKYPIHRGLISLNKRFTGRSDPEFNLRHDWNSLLETDIAPMTSRTKERFPNADVLYKYLQEFAQQQEGQGYIQYNTTVNQISRCQRSKEGGAFLLDLQTSLGKAYMLCKTVIHAGGNWKPNRPQNLLERGFVHATSYDRLSVHDSEKYENKRVCVVGMGNAGMETADALAPYAAYIHVAKGHYKNKFEFPHFAYETRYVGSPRTIRSQTFDAYLLKSLDGGFNMAAEEMRLHKCGLGRKEICVFLTDPDNKDLLFFEYNAKSSKANLLITKFENLGAIIQDSEVRSKWHVARSETGRSRQEEIQAADQHHVNPEHLEYYVKGGTHMRQLVLNGSVLNDETVDLFADMARISYSPDPLIYDEVITCLGFKHETGIYAPEVKPLMQANGRFPILTDEYEAVGVPGLFYAGSVAHGKDFKRAAGGFIHGFRYTAKALVRILGEKRAVPEVWPHDVFADIANKVTKKSNMTALAQHLLNRINRASSMYQLVHVMGDGVVFQCDSNKSSLNAVYFEDMPLEYFHKRFAGMPRLTMSFGYNGQRRSLEQSLNHGTQFEGFFWYLPGDCSKDWQNGPSKGTEAVPESRELLRLVESLSTQWVDDGYKDVIAEFLKTKSATMLSTKKGWARTPSKSGLEKPHVSAAAYVSGKADYEPWRVAEINVWVTNLKSEALALREATQEEPALIIQPGGGGMVRSHHLEVLLAESDEGREIQRFIVDLSNGIVQDFIIEDETCTATDTLAV